MALPVALPVGRIEDADSLLGEVGKRVKALDQRATKDFFSLDAKQQLAYYCHKKTGRNLTPADITYTTSQFDNLGFRSVVHVLCLDGKEFAGELCQERSKAEEAAAAQAMEAYKDEVSLLGLERVNVQADKKRKAISLELVEAAKKQKLDPGVIGIPGLVPASSAAAKKTNKVDLNTHCSKMVRRVMTKTDVQFTTEEVDGGRFQSVLTLPCLPGVWSTRSFVGEAFSKKADAEQSVAGVALAAIKNDAHLMSQFHRPKPTNHHKGRGKGKAPEPSLNVPFMQQAVALPSQLQVLAFMQGIPQTAFL